MFENNGNQPEVEEINLPNEEVVETENTPTEEVVEETKEPTIEKKYTDEDLNKIIAKRLARKEEKLKKQYENKYGRAESLLKAGLGVSSMEEATSQLEDFYKKKGVNIPNEVIYNDREIEVLANAEAEEIISIGIDEVIDEVDRLANIGLDNMSSRERAVFKNLANYRQNYESQTELASIGADKNVYDTEDFKTFASNFKTGTAIKDIYKYYTSMKGITQNTDTTPLGSMKNINLSNDKEYYTQDEVDKLTAKDYEDPKVMEKVRKSMFRW